MKKYLIAALTFLIALSCTIPGNENQTVLIQEGQADLTGDTDVLLHRLDGRWRFASEGNAGYIDVPSIWKGEIKSGTYELVLQIPGGFSHYSLYIRDCFTVYKLVVNGMILHEGRKPSIRPRIFTFSASDKVKIEIHAEDYETTFGGIKSSIYFGSPEKVQMHFYSRMFGDFLLAGCLLFSALIYLSIWIVDRKGGGREYLYLFAASIVMVLRILTTYNRFGLLFLDHFTVVEKISTITTPLIAIAYSLFFLRLYRYPGYTRVIRVFAVLSGIYSLMIITAPILFIYKVSPVYVLLILIAIYSTVHVSVIHFRTAELKRTVIVWLFVLASLLYLLIRSLLIWNGLVSDQLHHLYGLLMLLHGIHNAVRYGETFKHNVRLIKQKDELFSRVSHSFKSPLYVLKGSVELIRNSDQKCQEFEKQFKVLDSGITDLTVQINDLLNQTEFEFSHQMVQTRVPVTMSVQTVLIVDDQDVISSILGQQLKLFVKKLNLLTARSGEEALFILRTNNVDFIFSDIMMPRMDGYQFVTRCREKGYLVPIYLFSAGSDPKSRGKALDVGANGYLEKPATIEQLKKVTNLHLLHIPD